MDHDIDRGGRRGQDITGCRIDVRLEMNQILSRNKNRIVHRSRAVGLRRIQHMKKRRGPVGILSRDIPERVGSVEGRGRDIGLDRGVTDDSFLDGGTRDAHTSWQIAVWDRDLTLPIGRRDGIQPQLGILQNIHPVCHGATGRHSFRRGGHALAPARGKIRTRSSRAD